MMPAAGGGAGGHSGSRAKGPDEEGRGAYGSRGAGVAPKHSSAPAAAVCGGSKLAEGCEQGQDGGRQLEKQAVLHAAWQAGGQVTRAAGPIQ